MTEQKQTLSVADLQAFPMFQDLEGPEVVAFLGAAKVRSYAPGRTLVFRQGDEADGFYVILSGEIEITSTDTVLRKHLLGTLREGEFFGEMSLIENKPRGASAEARGDARLIFLSCEAFRELQSTNAAILNKVFLRMMAEMSNRLRNMGQRYITAKAAFGSF